MKKVKIVNVFLSLTLLLCGCAKEVNEVQETPQVTDQVIEVPVIETKKARLFMCGDALLHGAVYYAAQDHDTYDFGPMMQSLGTLSHGYDLKYYNQETLLGGTELGLSSYPCFNSPQEFGDTMMNLGFNLVSTANNHSLDKGETGILKSLAYWDKQDAVVSGTFRSFEEQQAIPVYDINGISYTFLSYTYGCNGLVAPSGKEYLVNVYPGHVDEMLEQVKKASEISDVVMVAMHWGVEYTNKPTQEQKELAKQLADAGATIVIGNHPHAIQPIERIGDCVVFYAFGNCISGQNTVLSKIGMVGGLTIVKEGTKDDYTISLEDIKADLIYTYDWYDASGKRQYLELPMNELTDEILPNHEEIYEEYKQVINALDSNVQAGKIKLSESEIHETTICEDRRHTNE